MVEPADLKAEKQQIARAFAAQSSLFDAVGGDEQAHQVRELEHVPWTFKYRYTCATPAVPVTAVDRRLGDRSRFAWFRRALTCPVGRQCRTRAGHCAQRFGALFRAPRAATRPGWVVSRLDCVLTAPVPGLHGMCLERHGRPQQRKDLNPVGPRARMRSLRPPSRD